MFQDQRPFLVDIFRLIKRFRIRSMLLLGSVLLLLTGSLWLWHQRLRPQAVFEGMISNNLSTNGVTKHIKTNNGSQTTDQYVQLSFLSPILARNLVVVNQTVEPKSTVKTETIGTLTADYSRYIDVQTSQKAASGRAPDFSKVKNVWGKNDDRSSLQYLNQAILGIVPFGQISGSQKSQVVDSLLQAYQVDYQTVKAETIAGHRCLSFKVTVTTEKYVRSLKALTKAMGMGDVPSLNPATYKDAQPVVVSISIDHISRQLVRVIYEDSQQTEDYQSYGVRISPALPQKTIPFSELQNRLQQIVQ